MPDPLAPPVTVVGLIGGECFGAQARAAIECATVVVGSERQLRLAGLRPGTEQFVLRAGLDHALEMIEQRRREGTAVCVLASGDPGFFGIVRILGERIGRDGLRVHPAPSSISLAFARLGSSWDDALVVSAHGRPLADAAALVSGAAKAAVLTSPDAPPQAIATALLERGCGPRDAAVISRIGEPQESIFEGDLYALAAGTFEPMSIVILRAPDSPGAGMGLAWGSPEHEFAHRDGMITKSEVRAVALGKLQLPRTGVLWDLGAGSGSVAIEAARLCPGLRVIAVEQDDESADRIDANARAHSVAVDVVRGTAPGVLAGLPDPDRVFVGGGGIDALDAALHRLRPGGVVVANYALLDRAVLGWQRLGNIVEVTVSRGAPLGEGSVRLVSNNPVFLCWGPS
ncbi:MAG: precorrin-6y C5,15-methyltransferase (decarboxylating) subunit CbiE [Acidimicrobiia bacterium]